MAREDSSVGIVQLAEAHGFDLTRPLRWSDSERPDYGDLDTEKFMRQDPDFVRACLIIAELNSPGQYAKLFAGRAGGIVPSEKLTKDIIENLLDDRTKAPFLADIFALDRSRRELASDAVEDVVDDLGLREHTLVWDSMGSLASGEKGDLQRAAIAYAELVRKTSNDDMSAAFNATSNALLNRETLALGVLTAGVSVGLKAGGSALAGLASTGYNATQIARLQRAASALHHTGVRLSSSSNLVRGGAAGIITGAGEISAHYAYDRENMTTEELQEYTKNMAALNEVLGETLGVSVDDSQYMREHRARIRAHEAEMEKLRNEATATIDQMKKAVDDAFGGRNPNILKNIQDLYGTTVNKNMVFAELEGVQTNINADNRSAMIGLHKLHWALFGENIYIPFSNSEMRAKLNEIMGDYNALTPAEQTNMLAKAPQGKTEKDGFSYFFHGTAPRDVDNLFNEMDLHLNAGGDPADKKDVFRRLWVLNEMIGNAGYHNVAPQAGPQTTTPVVPGATQQNQNQQNQNQQNQNQNQQNQQNQNQQSAGTPLTAAEILQFRNAYTEDLNDLEVEVRRLQAEDIARFNELMKEGLKLGFTPDMLIAEIDAKRRAVAALEQLNTSDPQAAFRLRQDTEAYIDKTSKLLKLNWFSRTARLSDLRDVVRGVEGEYGHAAESIVSGPIAALSRFGTGAVASGWKWATTDAMRWGVRTDNQGLVQLFHGAGGFVVSMMGLNMLWKTEGFAGKAVKFAIAAAIGLAISGRLSGRGMKEIEKEMTTYGGVAVNNAQAANSLGITEDQYVSVTGQDKAGQKQTLTMKNTGNQIQIDTNPLIGHNAALERAPNGVGQTAGLGNSKLHLSAIVGDTSKLEIVTAADGAGPSFDMTGNDDYLSKLASQNALQQKSEAPEMHLGS